MRIDVLTIFPEFFGQVFDFGIIRRAKLARIVEINVHDIREFTTDKHKMVDDRPFGGGDGMVLKPEPIFAAVEHLLGTSEREKFPATTRVVLLTPQGRPLKQAVAKEFAEDANRLLIICGRYEGVDERVNETLVTDEISIGDYVLSGGEPAAVVLTDSIVRLLPEALRAPCCLKIKSCSRSSGSCATTMARSTAFSSSRTLPIHGCCCSCCIAGGLMRVMCLFIACENFRTKCSTSKGMSSRRSRRGGSSM